jgi:hypothetical protein
MRPDIEREQHGDRSGGGGIVTEDEVPTSEDDTLDEDEIEPEAEDSELAPLLDEAEARCKAASIKADRGRDPDGDRYLRVHMPSGRDTQILVFYSSSQLRSLLKLPFETYTLLSSYQGICSYKARFVEVCIATASATSLRYLWRIVASVFAQSEDPSNTQPLTLSNDKSAQTIMLGPPSAALRIIGIQPFIQRPQFSLRLEGFEISRHDQAEAIAERVANSLFFQLDLLRNLPITLVRRTYGFRRRFTRYPRDGKRLEFPKGEYDREPMALYWYARSATGMPLLQFLAYYQTIEYYFPTYSQAEARRKIRNILKSPAFRPERDADVAKLLLAAHSSGAGFGDERSQLRATLNECLEPGALRGFLTESVERSKHLSSKADGLTDKKIAIGNSDADLRNDVADRIYDIRCRIVHTKSGSSRNGVVDLLLPFSKEAELLYTDIELIQFVAREVLISGSSPSRFQEI